MCFFMSCLWEGHQQSDSVFAAAFRGQGQNGVPLIDINQAPIAVVFLAMVLGMAWHGLPLLFLVPVYLFERCVGE